MPGKADQDEAKLLNDKAGYQAWDKEIQDALKREKNFRKLGRKCVELYEGKKVEETPFAILYSNTETLIPAVYNARPIPIVTRRFKDADPVGKAVAETSTRMLKYLIDCGAQDYDTFDELMPMAVLDGLLTNRGLTRFKFFASENKNYSENVVGEAVRWDKFLHGYARTWKKVPWIAFEWDMSKEELQENFPKAKFDPKRLSESKTEETDDPEVKEELTGVQTFKVFEIWDKASRKVIFISPCYPEGILRRVDDPLQLTGFFPTPKPLNFTRKSTTLIPTPLYMYYKQQAEELNEVTRRLKNIIRAIRYRGAYNSAVEGIEKILEAEDNQMVPVENVASMPDGQQGIDKLLWTVPVQELAATAQQLYGQREGIKQVIYEITGISDILRGSSQASETATAQNIKNQWGTLRLKRMQKEVQRYCRDALEIVLEIAGQKFETTTIKAMTGLPFLEQAQKAALEQQKAALEQAQQPLPPVPPEVMIGMQSPTWEEITEVLRNDVVRMYKTDIETNSTLDAEAAQDKQDISELLNAISQFLNGIGPLVQQGVMSMELAKGMLLTISRRYNFGSQLEDAINAMETNPGNKESEEESAAAKAEQELRAQETQAKTAEIQMKMQLANQEFAHKQAMLKMEQENEQLQLQIKREELDLQRQSLRMKMEAETMKHQQRMQQAALRGTQNGQGQQQSSGPTV